MLVPFLLWSPVASSGRFMLCIKKQANIIAVFASDTGTFNER